MANTSFFTMMILLPVALAGVFFMLCEADSHACSRAADSLPAMRRICLALALLVAACGPPGGGDGRRRLRRRRLPRRRFRSDPTRAPPVDTNPADYPANVWVTDAMAKVQPDATPGDVKWAILWAAQNETESFQVHVPRRHRAPIELSVMVTTLGDPFAGTQLSASSVVVSREAVPIDHHHAVRRQTA